MRPNNPFLIAGYHSPEFFCDREMETATILDALYNGRNITLIAPRRMGKTGLIRHAFYRLKGEEPDIVTIYMDIYPTQSLGDFVRLFANAVLGKLDTVPQKALSRIRQFIRSCRPVFTLDELTGVPKVTIDVAPAEEEATLKEIFDYLGSSEKRCYIAIDEFQQIAEYPEKGVEALLRSYIQFVPNVNFIFAGSKQHVMQEMFTSSKKPFYQSTQLLTIGAIDRDKYADFATGHFLEHNLQLPLEVFEAIYDKFEGHTWYIQNLLNRLYGYNRHVDEELVAYAVQQIVSEQSYSYADLLKAYSPGHVRLLKAIAQEGCVKEVLAGDFISKHRLRAASSVRASLKKLLDNELVYQTSCGYIIYDRFLGEWLRNQVF
ncbi:ATP-binding protein [Parabacteroides sp. ZJ-118]|uniref:AAA family ATPase n=1 Tax=Parabacteroides sp. ZJ-118 TaxID=2709398 RepID=UPI0013EB6881|nr:ATP-binding protein [Parabacteroides sp. ZJ-118]